jgi:DNA mismatch endonuclease (patch repair protein)
MSGIRSKDTAPEVLIRKALYSRGFRYRLHVNTLPGKPDIVLPKYRAIILVNGCFWHAHSCHLFKWPESRKNFWREKIGSNVSRDKRNLISYGEQGWRTLIIWECSIKGKCRLPLEEVISTIENWILYGNSNKEITGTC